MPVPKRLKPATGCLNGLLLGAVLWLVILMVWSLYEAVQPVEREPGACRNQFGHRVECVLQHRRDST